MVFIQGPHDAPVPTEFRGRRYRSRLEARWAAFFTLLNWKFEYEPYDLKGWFPDFLIKGEQDDILVEVKPATSTDGFNIPKMARAINLSGTSLEVLLLGSTIFREGSSHTGPVLGWILGFLNEDEVDLDLVPDEAAFNFHDRRFGFFAANGWWKDRITGRYDGANLITYPEYGEIEKMWNQAGNMVQWKPPVAGAR